MPEGRMTLTPADFVEAAMRFVDADGLEGLTMRSLGEHLGVDPTALYRHFPSKDALIAALVDDMLGEILSDTSGSDGTPRVALRHLALRARRTFLSHPNLMPAFITSSGQFPNGLLLMGRLSEGLEALGLTGAELVRCQQMLEAVVIGASVYDLSGSPHHHEIRRLRFRAVEHPAWDDQSRSADDVADLTEAAFAEAIDALLDRCESLAAASADRRR